MNKLEKKITKIMKYNSLTLLRMLHAGCCACTSLTVSDLSTITASANGTNFLQSVKEREWESGRERERD